MKTCIRGAWNENSIPDYTGLFQWAVTGLRHRQDEKKMRFTAIFYMIRQMIDVAKLIFGYH